MNGLHGKIRVEPEVRTAPDGKEYLSVSTGRIGELSEKYHCSIKEIEVLCLEMGMVPERYQRNLGTVSIKGQIRLLESKVAVVGAGGLGGCAFELLLRAGIGRLSVIDDDEFAQSNLNRQLLSRVDNIGTPKVEAAKQRAAVVNPAVQVETFNARANEESLGAVIAGSHAVLDGLDDIRTRYVVERVAKKHGIPFVHGAVAGFWGQVMTIFPGDRGLEVIYGPEPEGTPGDEKELGVLGLTASTVAAFQVLEVIKVILGWPEVIRNRPFVLDMKTASAGFVDLA